MPYLKKDRRVWLEEGLQFLRPSTPGDLNYLFTRIIQQYVKEAGESYAAYNAAIGALEAAKLELYRRQVAPYEDRKIAENGDI